MSFLLQCHVDLIHVLVLVIHVRMGLACFCNVRMRIINVTMQLRATPGPMQGASAADSSNILNAQTSHCSSRIPDRMEELKNILESSPTASPVHPDPRAHDMGKLNILVQLTSAWKIVLVTKK